MNKIEHASYHACKQQSYLYNIDMLMSSNKFMQSCNAWTRNNIYLIKTFVIGRNLFYETVKLIK